MSLTVTDLFAGGGGSSTGLAQVPGVQVRHAANHWPYAIAVHNTNHPTTDHSCVDLHQEDPHRFPTTDLLWASPECTKWSQANGSPLPAIEEGLFEDPLSSEAAQRSRLLMFDVLRFAEHHRYRAMIVENVVDIASQAKYATAWALWRSRLTALGYRHRVVSLNSMHAQLLGLPAPQSRDRIYIVCWREGECAPDVERALRPYAWCPRCAAVIEATQSWKTGRTAGRYGQSYRYVHGKCGAVVEPGWRPAADAIDWSIPGQRIGDRARPLAEKTIARVAAGIARYWGPIHLEASGNQYDAADPNHPAHGNPNGYYRAWSCLDPLKTLNTRETKALAVPVEGRDGKSAFMAELRGGSSDARPLTDPMSTLCASGTHHALVSPYYGTARTAHPVTSPIGTLTTVDRYALVQRMNTGGAEMTTPAFEPLRTLTTKGHQALIQAGPRGGRPPLTPEDIEAARALVPDVLLRMLRPHELAAATAFPAAYDWSAINPKTGRPGTARDLARIIGNAVTPPAARDIGAVVVAAITGEDVAA